MTPVAKAREARCSDADPLPPDGETKEQLQSQLTEACKERDEAKAWAELVTRGKSLCGHWKCYTHSEDGGKLIQCYQCQTDSLLQQIERLQQEQERLMRELGSQCDSRTSRTAPANEG
jgi:hypothetical protein